MGEAFVRSREKRRTNFRNTAGKSVLHFIAPSDYLYNCGYEQGHSGDERFHKIRCKICAFQTVPARDKHAFFLSLLRFCISESKRT